MNRGSTVMPSRAEFDRARSGDERPAAEPGSSPRGTPSSWLGPGDAGILVAFAASFAALIVIWGVALGYLRY